MRPYDISQAIKTSGLPPARKLSIGIRNVTSIEHQLIDNATFMKQYCSKRNLNCPKAVTAPKIGGEDGTAPFPIEQAMSWHDGGLSVRAITKRFNEQGIMVGRSTIHRAIMKGSQTVLLDQRN